MCNHFFVTGTIQESVHYLAPMFLLCIQFLPHVMSLCTFGSYILLWTSFCYNKSVNFPVVGSLKDYLILRLRLTFINSHVGFYFHSGSFYTHVCTNRTLRFCTEHALMESAVQGSCTSEALLSSWGFGALQKDTSAVRRKYSSTPPATSLNFQTWTDDPPVDKSASAQWTELLPLKGSKSRQVIFNQAVHPTT